MNQMAGEIAKEYEEMAIKAANEHYHLKRHQPFTEFPALAAHVKFCTDLQETWATLARKLDGPNIYGANDDMKDRWGLCD